MPRSPKSPQVLKLSRPVKLLQPRFETNWGKAMEAIIPSDSTRSMHKVLHDEALFPDVNADNREFELMLAARFASLKQCHQSLWILLDYSKELQSPEFLKRLLDEAVLRGSELVVWVITEWCLKLRIEIPFDSLRSMVQWNMYDVLKMIKDADASRLQQTNARRETLLYGAVRDGNQGMVQALVKWGVPMQTYCSNGKTPLCTAIRLNRTEIAKWLIEQKCPLDSRSPSGCNLLHLAAQSQNLELIKLLCQKGVSTQETTVFNLRPLDLAIKTGNSDCVTYLQTHT